MERSLIKFGAVVTALTGVALYLVASPAEVLLAGFAGGIAVGVRAGHWNDEVIAGGASALVGGGLLFVGYTVFLIAQIALNPSDALITVSIAGVTYGYALLLIGIVPLFLEGALGAYVSRWLVSRTRFAPDRA